MAEMLLVRTPQGTLAPTRDEDVERIRKYKVGAVVRCSTSQMRNYLFHKKWFALVQWAFELWRETAEMPTYKGEPVQPNFEAFREDVTILAGHRHAVVKLNGELRWAADSISFASMDEERFEKLFSATINVILGRILDRPDWTEEKLRAHIDYLMTFD